MNVEILGVNDSYDSTYNYLMTGGRRLAWLQDTVEQNVWGRWKVTYRDVRILDARNGLSAVINLTQFDLTYATNREALKTLFLNAARLIDTDGDGLSDDWEQVHFGNLLAGADDDMDGDGVPNLKEFAFGSNPVVASSTGVTRIEYRDFGTERRLAVVFARQAGGAFQYLLETSGDLKTWGAGTNGFGPPVVSNAFDGTGTSTMAVPLASPSPWPEARCFRVKALTGGSESPAR